MRENVARGRQGLERRPVDLLVEGAAADAQLLHRPVVELVEEDADRRVQGAEAEERLVAELGEDPAFKILRITHFPAHAGMELLTLIKRTPADRDRVA